MVKGIVKMSSFISKNSDKTLEYNITTHKKGFSSTTLKDGKNVTEYFQFKEISQIIHHPDIGIEIIGYNNGRRVFYNDIDGESLNLYTALNQTMVTWMESNLN